MLCDFLNRQLRADEFPSALREAQVALIPAIIAITGHGGHRPRHLLECLNKVYSVGFYITTRLTTTWNAPQVQLGGMKGSQVCDTLMTAQCRTTRDSKEAQYSIYLPCDIQTAFEAWNHAVVAQVLLDECGVQHGIEAVQMLKLLTIIPARGQPQCGGTCMSEAHGEKQSKQGESTRHSSIILLFMDDLLFAAFDGCQHAIALTEELQQVL